MAQLLQNALYGTALILTAALLRRILAHRLIPEARLVLWALCLLRLLAPAAPGSALALWGLLAGPAPQPAQTPQVSSPVQTVPAAPAPAPQPAAPGEADRRAREDMERLRAYLKQQEKEGT